MAVPTTGIRQAPTWEWERDGARLSHGPPGGPRLSGPMVDRAGLWGALNGLSCGFSGAGFESLGAEMGSWVEGGPRGLPWVGPVRAAC